MKKINFSQDWIPLAIGAAVLLVAAAATFFGGQFVLSLAEENSQLRSNQPAVVNTADIRWNGGIYTRTDETVRVTVAVDTGRFGTRIQSCVNKILVHVNSDPAGYLNPTQPILISQGVFNYPQPAAVEVLSLKRGEEYTISVSADHFFQNPQPDKSIGQGIAEASATIRPETDMYLNFILSLPWRFVNEGEFETICQK